MSPNHTTTGLCVKVYLKACHTKIPILGFVFATRKSSMLRGTTRHCNVHDPVFMRNVKKAFSKYKAAMDTNTSRPMSREAFVDLDDKGAAWYLGHMNLATTELQNKVKHADFVLEMRDARLPFTTENPNLRKLIGDKPHLIVFNKAELANEDCNLAVQRFYESQGTFSLFTSARRTWRDTVEAVSRFVTHVVPAKQFRTAAYVGLVVGMPNVGKSTLINSLRMAHEYQFHKDDFHRSRTGETVSMKPGTTRGVKMVPICRDPNVVLYDSPGLTVPGCFAKEAGLKLAACGIVPTNDLSLTKALVARYIYDVMTAAGASEHMAECLHLPRAPVSFDDCVALICERSGRSAQSELGQLMPVVSQSFIIHDFQMGKLGKLTLDKLPKRVREQFTVQEERPKLEDGREAERASHATMDVDSKGEFRWTYHVESQEAAPAYPEELKSVLEEVHLGRSADVHQRQTSNAASSPRKQEVHRSADEFVISRKKGAIARATSSDEAFLRCTRIRRGR